MKTPTAQPLPATPKACGVWIRVSTDEQAQSESPQYHEARAREYAKFNGWEVREVYDLAGVSGKSVMDHPEAKRMLADIKRGHIKALIFSKLARLARNVRELLDFADLFRANGAEMVSLQERIDTSTPAGRLFYNIIASMAAFERDEVADRVRASIVTRAKMGRPISGKTPYGYRWVDRKLVQDPAEAAILKQAFALFGEHRRKGAVARKLNEAGYRTRVGKKWSDMAVGRVLATTTAKGVYVYNVSRRVGAWKTEEKPESEWGRIEVEPVVTEAVWDATARALEEQAKENARPGRTPVHVFASRAVCSCGTRMYVPSGGRKYACKACKNKIPAETLEAIFREKLCELFRTPEAVSAHIEAAERSLAERAERVAAHRREIAKVRDDMARTHRLYLEGHVPIESFGEYHKPLAERLTALQSELPRLEAEEAHLSVRDISADAVAREVADLHNRWASQSNEERRVVVEAIVDQIVIGAEEVELRLAYKPPSEPATTCQQNLTHPLHIHLCLMTMDWPPRSKGN